MKTMIAFSVLALASATASADWEDVFQNPDLSVNYQGYSVDVRLPAEDPVARAFPGNHDLYSGDTVEGGPGANYGELTSLDEIVKGSPDSEV